jgi:hypothetical protein
MSNIYLGAGKGDTPRSCNSEAYLTNYDKIFRKTRGKLHEIAKEKKPYEPEKEKKPYESPIKPYKRRGSLEAI